MKLLTKLAVILILGGSLTLSGGTKLSKAAISGDLEKVKECVSSGEKINEIDKWGWTPLMWAVYYRQDIVTKWILSHDADPNIKSTMLYGEFPIGTTPLGLAAYYGQEAQLTMLLASKADPSIADSKGTKPIDYAKQYEFEGCASILTGTYKGISNLHSSTNRIIPGKINNVFIVLGSSAQKSMPYLVQIKGSIEEKLAARSVRFVVHVLDPMGLDEEKNIAMKMETFKPDFVITVSESSATLRKELLSDDVRVGSTVKVELRRNGNQATLWGKDIIAKDSGINPGPFSSPNSDIASVLTKALVEELEADLLL